MSEQKGLLLVPGEYNRGHTQAETKTEMEISIRGTIYKVRYTYRKEDGSEWYVTDATGGLQGKYGDEWPV